MDTETSDPLIPDILEPENLIRDRYEFIFCVNSTNRCKKIPGQMYVSQLHEIRWQAFLIAWLEAVRVLANNQPESF